MEMICSPVINPAGQVVQVVAVVWDATGTRRLQQKIDAIDKAGRELVRLEADAMSKMNVGQRLKLLEDKIISFTRDLMHFDHFAIRLLDRRTQQARAGHQRRAADRGAEHRAVRRAARATASAATSRRPGRSYICPDVERDPRYVIGLDQRQEQPDRAADACTTR